MPRAESLFLFGHFCVFSPCAADLLRVFGVVERERVYYAIKNATRHVLLGARMRDGLPTHTHTNVKGVVG